MKKKGESVRFYNKGGELSAYGFACGYNMYEIVGDYMVQIYMEHSHFHVKMGLLDQRPNIWETFQADELTKARKFYKDMIKQAKRLQK